jgi:hypothetical protein
LGLTRCSIRSKIQNRREGCPVPRSSAEWEVLQKLDTVTWHFLAFQISAAFLISRFELPQAIQSDRRIGIMLVLLTKSSNGFETFHR